MRDNICDLLANNTLCLKSSPSNNFPLFHTGDLLEGSRTEHERSNWQGFGQTDSTFRLYLSNHRVELKEPNKQG